MVVRLNSQLNLHPSLMSAAADLLVESGRAKGAGLAALGHGIETGLRGLTAKRKYEAEKAVEETRYQDAKQHQAIADRLRVLSMQDEMDAGNLAVAQKNLDQAKLDLSAIDETTPPEIAKQVMDRAAQWEATVKTTTARREQIRNAIGQVMPQITTQPAAAGH